MKNKQPYNIVLFSIDVVYNQLIMRILEKTGVDHKLVIHTSFSDTAKLSREDNIHLIIVNDLVIGTSSFELISFLRLTRLLACPIIYFGVSEYDGERRAFATGANYFIKKPFRPDQFLEILNAEFNKLQQEA